MEKEFDDEYIKFIMEAVEEANRDEKMNEIMSQDEFWQKVKELNQEERRTEKYIRIQKMKNIKLRLIRNFGKISKRFIKV